MLYLPYVACCCYITMNTANLCHCICTHGAPNAKDIVAHVMPHIALGVTDEGKDHGDVGLLHLCHLYNLKWKASWLSTET